MASKSLARQDRWLTQGVLAQLEDLEQDLGGRQQIVQLLALAPLTPDLRYILGMLGDPKHATRSLAQICAGANILPGELLKQLRSAAVLRGQVRTAQIVSRHIPQVVEDVMRRAQPYEDQCHACRGIGTITADPTPQQSNPSPQPCETCQGTGRLVYRPTLDTQRMAIDLAQLLPKAGAQGGVNILQQFGSGGGGPTGGPAVGSGGSPLERLAQLTDKLLYGSGAGIEEGPGDGPSTPLDGEVVPPAGEEGRDVQKAE